jgi:acylphosphatase
MRKAIELGVCGYVTNLSDGSVQIQAEAEKNILEYFIDWCQCGPPNAVIEQIEIQTCDPSGLSGFVVK